MKIVIFGTGSCCKEMLSKLNFENVEVKCFLDNDKSIQNTELLGIPVYNPEKVKEIEYDYVLVASEFILEILPQLVSLGIELDKIIPAMYEDFIKSLEYRYSSTFTRIFNKRKVNNKKKIGLIKMNNSGSNTLALFKNIPFELENKFEVELITREQLSSESNYDLICTTSIYSVYDPSVINIQLWHGVPLKKVGTRTPMFEQSYSKKVRQNTTKIISTSETYSTLFNSSFPNDTNKYEVLGMPRNDLLFKKDSQLMKNVFGDTILEKKVIVYLPTYRQWDKDMIINGDRNWNNIFGFENFDLAGFAKFLEENNMYFICKLHHMEFNTLDVKSFKPFAHVMKILKEDDLVSRDIDLYEVLANIDLLITDYSSVYFDLLMRDTKLLFLPVDLDSYNRNRGFNLEPYEFWTPGPKAFTQEGLKNSILGLFDNDLYKKDRQSMLDVFHKYQDNQSSVRVWTMIDELLQESEEEI